jgi:hypothetical protein
MRKIFFIIGLFVILLSACRSTRQVVQQATFDSTAVSYREVEKIIHIPGDTVVLVMPVRVSDNRPMPMIQTMESSRAKIRVEITRSGNLEATAICKELEEKVFVLEWTISNFKSEIKEYQVKESFLKKTIDSAKRTLRTVLITLVLLLIVYTVFKLGFNPISIIKKIINHKS